jgi:hypothetical protein
VAARQTAPVIGALCNASSDSGAVAGRPHHFTVTIGYRYQQSDRHFIGTDEQVQREINHNQIENDYHLFDLGVEYQLTPRWSVMGSLPIIKARRDQLYAPKGIYHVSGIGDATAGVRAWLFRPPTESGGNVALGISLKMPTGTYDSVDHAVTSKGQAILATADQSLQAGDGGWGFALDTQAYKPFWKKTILYLSGAYLFNPRDTNGANTFRTKPGETVMSVSDQYLFRGGVSHAVPRFRGLTASIGGRIEGVPVRDAFGGSNGFRRPGYAISVDPGFSYARSRYSFSMNIPWAVERNRRRSVADIMNGGHGDAAFADYAIITSFSRFF